MSLNMSWAVKEVVSQALLGGRHIKDKRQRTQVTESGILIRNWEKKNHTVRVVKHQSRGPDKR